MFKSFSILFISLLVLEASAQSLQWNQPEVVPEKLARANRRVLRFSGTAKVGTQIRVRDNKVKMIFNTTKVRWARIPQKHRVQFPVIANDTGYFSFELYLPTVPVEIPLELFKGGKWVPYRFSFEVPESGAADDFKFVEESFKIRKDEENVKIEDFLAEYDSDEDRGQVVNDRGEWKSWVTGKVIVWGSLGFSYMTLEQTLTSNPPPDELGTFGGMSFPYWEVGGEYRWNAQWKVDLAYMNRPGEAKEDGAYIMQSTDMEWSELRANLSYFPFSWEKETYRLGFKGGISRHDLPFVKRTGVGNYRVFSNDAIFLAAGASFETMRAKAWNFDASAQFLYPVTSGGEFDMSSSYGLNMNLAIFKEIIPALSLGGKVDFSWLTFEADHPEITLPTSTVTSDTTLWQFTPSFLLKAEF
ncbi:hypothetical protein K2X05_04145 [bacterium]|nr:hypothetical protein [bacterium]